MSSQSISTSHLVTAFPDKQEDVRVDVDIDGSLELYDDTDGEEKQEEKPPDEKVVRVLPQDTIPSSEQMSMRQNKLKQQEQQRQPQQQVQAQVQDQAEVEAAIRDAWKHDSYDLTGVYE